MNNKQMEIVEIMFSCFAGIVAGVAIFYWGVYQLILWVVRVYNGQN